MKTLTRASFLVWAGLIAFGLPEIFAGTGRLWLVRPEIWLLTIPLYALHFLLLSHFAVATGRITWPALYALGVIFGLYEGWITKVIWTGYPGSDGFAMGSVGAHFGLHETLGLVLFYHAVTSFLLPLAVMCTLFPAWARAFPPPVWLFGHGWWALAARLVLAGIWGVISGHNMPDPGVYLATWLPFLALAFGGYALLRRAGVAATSPRLGRFGLILILAWLAAIYVVTWRGLLPERLPPGWVQAITLLLYLPPLAVLLRTKRTLPAEAPALAARPGRWLLVVFGIGLVWIALAQAATGLAEALAIAAFLAMIGLGAVLGLWLLMWRGLVRGGVRDRDR